MISKPVRLTTSLLCWGKVSWLCCVQVNALMSYWFDNLGFFLRENLLLYSSYLPLGAFQRTCDRHVSNSFSSASYFLALGTSSLLQGESLTSNLFYFVIVLLSLLLLCVVCFLYQKSKKYSYLLLVYFLFVIILLILFLLCVVCFLYKKTKKN